MTNKGEKIMDELFTVEKAHALTLAVYELYHADIITSEQLGDYIDRIDEKTEEE
ncbi:hypothetical protein JARJAR_25 [Bacillus phage vB_BanH_JarJar]|nr:hypothetical protein JARJAR_25 [Bacillus phage vB_BanH_JarJar]UGO50330.1 hypothetical protein RONSWANSON_24 [Bacillus phage vB_BanH_RonSwanson]